MGIQIWLLLYSSCIVNPVAHLSGWNRVKKKRKREKGRKLQALRGNLNDLHKGCLIAREKASIKNRLISTNVP